MREREKKGKGKREGEEGRTERGRKMIDRWIEMDRDR